MAGSSRNSLAIASSWLQSFIVVVPFDRYGTCGLSIGEITGIENGEDATPDRLRRIAAALRLPETALIDA